MNKLRKKIKALYNSLPKIECKGLCMECCGPIAFTPEEGKAIAEIHGKPLEYDALRNKCGALRDNRCTVHEVRPMLCRLYGVVDDPRLRCPFGCIPDRWLTSEEGHELMAKMEEIGGPMVNTITRETGRKDLIWRKRHGVK